MFKEYALTGYGLTNMDIKWSEKKIKDFMKEEIYLEEGTLLTDMLLAEELVTDTCILVAPLEGDGMLLFVPAKMSWEHKHKDEIFESAEDCKDYFWKKIGQRFTDMAEKEFKEQVDFVNELYMGEC